MPDPDRAALLFGATWLLAELARGVIFTGFPWLASGYAQVDAPLAALAPWVGVYGLGFVLAVLSAWPAFAWAATGGPRALVGPALALVVVLGGAALLGPGHFTRANGTLSVTLLQGNVAQDEKFASEAMPEALAWTRDHLIAARGELVVAPETVIPVLPAQLDAGYWHSILDHFQQGSQAVVLGLPLGNDDVGYTNSAIAISAATIGLPQGYYRYDKHHLVPSASRSERFPLVRAVDEHPARRLQPRPGRPGVVRLPRRAHRRQHLLRGLVREELAARFENAAAAPTVFANISNIGWFGDTSAIAQHLQISRMRTLEFQVPMLRATNTGATAVIDHTGRVTAALPRLTQGVLDAEVQGRTGLTPFAWWASRFGLWPLWLLGAGLTLGLPAARRQTR